MARYRRSRRLWRLAGAAASLGSAAIASWLLVSGLALAHPLVVLGLGLTLPFAELVAIRRVTKGVALMSGWIRPQDAETQDFGRAKNRETLEAWVAAAAGALGLSEAPPIVLRRDATPNAAVTLRTELHLVINTSLLKTLTEEQIRAILLHELAHVRLARPPWSQHAVLMGAVATMPVLGATVASLEAGLGFATIPITLVTIAAVVGVRALVLLADSRQDELAADHVAAMHAGRLPTINALLRLATMEAADAELWRQLVEVASIDGKYPLHEVWKARRDRLPPPTTPPQREQRQIREVIEARMLLPGVAPTEPTEHLKAQIAKDRLRWEGAEAWTKLDWRDYDFVPDGKLDENELACYVRALEANPRAQLTLDPEQQNEPDADWKHPSFRTRILALASAPAEAFVV